MRPRVRDICGFRVHLGAVLFVVVGLAGAAAAPETARAGALGLTITSGPTGTVMSNSATFTFQSKDPATFQCSLDRGVAADCSSGSITYDNLVNGRHLFVVVATAASGAASEVARDVQRQTWIVAAPPDTTIVSAPPPSTSSHDAAFTFESQPTDASFECNLDGLGFAGCASPKSFSTLAVGRHTFQVRAVDAIGTDPTPAVVTWTIVAPPVQLDTRITSSPRASTTSTSATISFVAVPPGAGFECSLDGRAFVACTSPTTYSSLRRTRHTFDVRARTATTTDPSPAQITWSIGLPMPDTVITRRPAAKSKDRTARIAFKSIPGGAGFECSLDGGSFKPCASPTRLARLGVGSHSFHVRARNTGGIDASPASAQWTITRDRPFSWIVPVTGGAGGGGFLAVLGIGFVLRRRFRLRLHLQASDEEPTGHCEGKGWRCHKELTLKPGRRQIAHVSATASRSVHKLDDEIVSKLNDAVDTYRHARHPADEVRLALLPIAEEVRQDLNGWLESEREDRDSGAIQIALEAHLEGGKAECVLTPWRCHDGGWRKHRPWKIEVADERDEPVATILHPGTTVASLVGHLATFVTHVDVPEPRAPEAAAVPHA